MNETTPAVRRPIDAAQIDEWRNECLAAARHGTDEKTLEGWLKENGCPPRLRQDILLKARAERRTHHRALGAKALGIGVVLCVAGAAIAVVSYSGVPVGGHMRVSSGRAMLGGLALMGTGLTPLLFGAWKALTGSTVAVETPER